MKSKFTKLNRHKKGLLRKLLYLNAFVDLEN
jgi:hypothetical protein